MGQQHGTVNSGRNADTKTTTTTTNGRQQQQQQQQRRLQHRNRRQRRQRQRRRRRRQQQQRTVDLDAVGEWEGRRSAAALRELRATHLRTVELGARWASSGLGLGLGLVHWAGLAWLGLAWLGLTGCLALSSLLKRIPRTESCRGRRRFVVGSLWVCFLS